MGKMIPTILGIAIAIIIVATILVPAVEDSDLKTRVDHNNIGTNYYNKMDTVNISITTGSEVGLTINGTSYDLPDYGFLLMSDSLSVANTGPSDGTFSAFDPTNNKYAIAGNGLSISIAIASGNYTATFGETTISGTIGDCYVFSGTTGSYVMATAGSINAGADAIAYVGGILWGAAQGVCEISDLSTGSSAYSLKTITDFQVSASTDSTVTWEVVDNDDKSYDVSAFADSSSTTPVNVILPSTYYTLEENSQTNLLNVIPIVVLVSILMAAVGLIVFRRL